MITLEDLRPSNVIVRAAGADIPLRPLRLGDFITLVRQHSAIAGALLIEPEKRVERHP